MAQKFKQSTLTSPTGAKLNLLVMAPKTKPKAVVQINHGMGEHAARYERFAQALVKAGYAVTAHDHRGHGHTTAADAPLGVYADGDGFTKVLADVDAVNSHIRDIHKDAPTVVFGHSMGAVIAANYAMRHPDRIAAWASWNAGLEGGALAAVFSLILRLQAAVKGRHGISNIAYRLTFVAWNNTFKPNRTDFDWLSRDEAEVDAYIADPLCGFDISIGLWQDLLAAIRFGAGDGNLVNLPKNLPVHLLAGGVDACTENGKHMQHLAQRLQSAGLLDVTLSVLPGTRHESLNETNRDQTTADFIAWLNARFT